MNLVTINVFNITDKEREVKSATEKIRNKMDDLKLQNKSCQDEIARLNAKLDESLAGLKAASRLGDQLESKTAQINDLKEQGILHFDLPLDLYLVMLVSFLYDAKRLLMNVFRNETTAVIIFLSIKKRKT